MKTSSLLVLSLALTVTCARAQGTNRLGDTTHPTAPVIPAPTPYQVVDIGPNHRVWQRLTYEPMPNGQAVAHVHAFTELASGLNFLNSSGVWTPSHAQIEAFSGGAISQQGQHKLIFANNLNSTGAIDMLTPEGKQIRSNILGLRYADPTTGQAVQIAALQDSEGELIANNQVLYPNALSGGGVTADVLYTDRLDGMEQDVILRTQLPAPESFGMNSATTELEVMTEFLSPPEATVTDLGTDTQTSEPDQAVRWGATSLGHGRAFILGGEDTPAMVIKRYVTVGGRYFLLEKVRWQAIQSALSQLPQQASNTRTLPGLASTHFTFPKAPVAKSAARPIRLARQRQPEKGYVLDYTALNTAYTNYCFQGDTTYYVSSALNLSGTNNTFEGGTVIKYAANASITAVAGSKVSFLSAPYQPVVFTAKDDDAVGQSISGSTGNPSGYYANPALNLSSMGAVTLAEFRISYAGKGVSVSGASPLIYDAQWVNCGMAVSDINGAVSLENVLLSNIKTNFNATSSANEIYVENVTFNNAFDLICGSFANTLLYVTNCVFVNVTNLSGNISAGFNGFYQAPQVGSSPVTNTFYPLQTVGAANCYLTNGCAFLASGTTNIYPGLLPLLEQKTTYPPIVYSAVTISTIAIFSPQAQRDTNCNPTFGYHYDSFDYVFGGVSFANNITHPTFTAGTAVGFFYNGSGGTYALALGDSVTASFNGTATAPCRWARYNTVQEGGNGNWTAQSYLGGITGQSYSSAPPAVHAAFLNADELSGEGNLIRDDYTLLVFNAQDSEFHCGGVGAYYASLTLTNCLFVNCAPGLYENYGADNLTMENCTVIRGGITADNTSGGAWPVTIVNCAFDSTTLYMNAHGGPTNGYHSDYNSFLLHSNTTLYLGGHEVTVTNSYNWQTSWFGDYYQPTNSTLIQRGSTTANNVGLYYFTTQTNQVMETNAVVDIGYHYVAVNTNGLPLANSNGVAYYLVALYGSQPPLIAMQPTNGFTLAGSNATFNAAAIGSSPLFYQWYFNGTNFLAGATNANLLLSNVQLTNAGNYSVVVTNNYGFATSQVAGLTVLGWTNTTPVTVAGGTAEFALSVSGPPGACAGPFSYQWQHDGTNIGSFITTVAGNFDAGGSYGGDGGPATSAGLAFCLHAAADAVGNVYISDYYNSVIRMVDTNGLIWTVAGNNGAGGTYAGDGGPATNASLSGASTAVVDAAGNLFIADSGNCVVRKVDSSGIITTVAGNFSQAWTYSGDGGAATNAGISDAASAYVDASGQIFIADYYNSVIRKVDTNGIIWTVAGNAALGNGFAGDGGAATNAELSYPIWAMTDGAGNLYIADSGNSVIRKVDTNGTITTVAGNNGLGGGYSGDGGQATNATLYDPSCACVDAAGNLYIGDYANNVVRKVDASGIITTVVGNNSLGGGYVGDGGVPENAALNGVSGVFLDAFGDLFIGDAGNNVIREVVSEDTLSIVDGTLMLSGVTTNNAGSYQVIVSSPCGSMASSIVTLTVVFPPTITTQPTNLMAMQGSNATFSVTATGTAPLSYQWYFNGTNLLAGATNATLTLLNVQPTNAGSYSVTVANAGGSVTSSNAGLLVIVDPNGNPSGDGLSNLQKYEEGLNTNTFYPTRLGYWRFNDPPFWLDESNLAPSAAYGLYPVPSWSGDAVSIVSPQNSVLAYPGVRPNGSAVAICPAGTGTIRFWFKPDWVTLGVGQNPGPDGIIRFFEVGEQSTNAAYGWFSLWADSDGTQMTFSTEANGIHTDNAVYPIQFTTNSWYQIILTFTPTNSQIYVNGLGLATNGLGVTNLPSQAVLQQGFHLGCSWDGVYQANGVFDELETFNYALAGSEVASNYQAVMSIDTYGTGLPDVVKNEYGLNPAAVDSDCEGLPDAWKIAHGLNPNDPTVATAANIALYVQGSQMGTTNVVTVTETNLVNIYFSSYTNNEYGAAITGAAVAGSNSVDLWNFCTMNSDYTNNGVPLADAAGNLANATLFAYIGPCVTPYAVPPTNGDWDESTEPYDITYSYYESASPPGSLNPGVPLFSYHLNLIFNSLYNPADLLKWWDSYYQYYLEISCGTGEPPPAIGSWLWDEFTNYYDKLCSTLPISINFESTQPPSVVMADLAGISSWPLGTWYDAGGVIGYGKFVGYDQFIATEVTTSAASAITQGNNYVSQLGTFILANPSLSNTVPAVIPPATVINTFLSPFASIQNYGYSLLNDYGATWSYSGNTNAHTIKINGTNYTHVTSGMWLKSMYPDAQRTLLVSGLTAGNYDVYVYYSCLAQLPAATINGTVAMPNPNSTQAQYWYANVNTKSIPAPVDYNSCLTSSVPPMAITNPSNYCLQINVGWPDVESPIQDVKILGLQLVTHPNVQYTSAVLHGGAGLNSAYLMWLDSGAETNFAIYRSTNDVSWTLVASTNEFQYQDTGLVAGTQYYYKVVGILADGTSEPASGVVSAVPFGCAPPLPPRIDYMNPLQLPPNNGTYTLSYQTLLTNSDALDPQGYPLVFKVDSVGSGSLTIDGTPFSVANNTISSTNSVVWTPPATMAAAGTPAFRVYVFDGQNRSSNTVNVLINQAVQTYLMGWGLNNDEGDGAYLGGLGTGIMDECQFQNGTCDYSGFPIFWFQNMFNIYQPEADWQLRMLNYDLSAIGDPPRPVLNVKNVKSVSTATHCDGGGHYAVTQDGYLWYWGSAGAYALGTPWVMGWTGGEINSESPIRLWDSSLPDTTEYYWDPLPVTILSPQLVQDPQTKEPMTGVVAAKNDFILKGDGSLWSFGDPNSALGRDPQLPTDLWNGIGLIPGRVEIPGNDQHGITPGREIIEINVTTTYDNSGGSFSALARCRDGSLWSWGQMQDGIEVGYDYEPYSFSLATDDGSIPLWQPKRLTYVESASSSPISQISEALNHIAILRANGSVSEIGYIPAQDPDRMSTPADLTDCIYGNFETIWPWGPELDFNTFYSTNPVVVPNTPPNIVQISVAPSFGALLTQAGEVWVWGQWLGNLWPEPQKLRSLSGIVKIAVGYQYITALDKRGRLWSIGYNNDGAFGFTDYNLLRGNPVFNGIIHTNAVPVPGVENVVDIFNGDAFWDSQVYALGTAVQGKPVGLSATPANQAVNLAWSTYPAASFYIVYRSLNEASGYVAIGTTSVNVYVDQSPPLQNGHTYYYEISAVVNGVETAPSWDVSATPYPCPGPVVQLTSVWACNNGVELQWQPATNAAASPLDDYVVMADGVQLAELPSDAIYYFDDREVINSNCLYQVIARNSSGQATNGIQMSLASTRIGCIPAPVIATNESSSGCWLKIVAGQDDLNDQATLVWTGTAPGTGTNSAWLFQPYEFDTSPGDPATGMQGTETVDSFIAELASAVPVEHPLEGWLWNQMFAESNSLTAMPQVQSATVTVNMLATNADVFHSWLWQQFTTNETSLMLNTTNTEGLTQDALVDALLNVSETSLSTNVDFNMQVEQLYQEVINSSGMPTAVQINLKLVLLTNLLNQILTNGAPLTNDFFVAAITNGLFAENGVHLRQETTNLAASSPQGAALVQAKRMLLDDYFAGKYFTRGGNWGSGLTGFRVHYRTIQYYEGHKLMANLQQDVPLNRLQYGWDSSSTHIDDNDLPCGVYSFSWQTPADVMCWASVSALVNGQESDISNEVGPQQANPTDTWDASIRAIPGYQQVYLDWNDQDNIFSYDVYYSTDTNCINDGNWASAPDGIGLDLNRYWHLNLTTNTTYYYMVVANFYDGSTSSNNYASATVVATNQPGQYQFSAFAYPYDGLVDVEWTVPTKTNSVPATSLNQTDWQFYVERKPDGTGDTNYLLLADSGFGLAFLDSDVVDGLSYTYRVTAYDTNFNRLQTNAMGYGGTSSQITPSATNGLTLLPPVPGNGYVNLAWSPIRATQFSIKRASNPGGPFSVVGSQNVNDAYQSAQNTYQDAGLQNGVMYYYQIAAITPTGYEIDSAVQGAMPLATLAPLPPTGFQGMIVPVQGANTVVLSWNTETGISQYQVFVQDQNSTTPIFTGVATSCLYNVPAGTDATTVLTFALRSASSQGLTSTVVTTVVTNQPIEVTSNTINPVVLQVAGSVGPYLMVMGPTNLSLSANVNVAGVSQVNFYDGTQLIGSVGSTPYQMTWYQAPGGIHLITASALVQSQDDVGGILLDSSPSGTFVSQAIVLTNYVEPQLSAYQTSVTDLQLPAPALPISLSRSYSSRNTNANSTLGTGWTPSWTGGSVTLSADLSIGWEGVEQHGFLANNYYISDTSGHYITVNLPNGSSIAFSPQLTYETEEGDTGGFAALQEDDGAVGINFQPFIVNSGTFSNSLNATTVDIPDDSLPWNGQSVSLESANLSQISYTSPDGTFYQFGQALGDNLTWLITQIADRNGNSLLYSYNGDNTIAAINNSCGRSVTFNYLVPPTTPDNVTNVEAYDSVAPYGTGLPVVVYVISNNLLTEVHQLLDRTSGAYLTNSYAYGCDSNGAPADFGRLTDVYDARGVRTLHNIYTNSVSSGYTGDLAIQISPGKTNNFTIDANYNLIVTATTGTATNTAEVTSDSSGAISGAMQPVSGSTASSTPATQCDYDSQGNLISQTDANGNTTTYTYDNLNRLVEQSDGNGESTSTTLNSNGQTTSSTDANGNETDYQYDNAGNPTSVSDPTGTSTGYAYSSPVTVGNAYLGEMQTSQSQTAPFVPYTIVTLNSYNTAGPILGDLLQTTEEWQGSGGTVVGTPVTTSYTYDANGNRTSEIKTRAVAGSTETNVTAYTYDAQNRVLTTTVSATLNGSTSLAPQTNTVTYNVLGKQATSMDAAGRVTTSVYDFNGNLIETEYPDRTVSRTAYDGFGHQQYVQDRAVPDGSGNTIAPATLSIYDASGRVTQTERCIGVELTKTTATAGDFTGLATCAAQVKMVVSSTGMALTTNFTFYDLVGNVQYSVDARGAVTQYQYDAANRRTNVLVYTAEPFTSTGANTPSPTGASQTTSYTYDGNGNQLTVTDAAGSTTTSVYDEANRVIEVDYPATGGGTVSQFTYYDGLGRKIQQNDEAGVATAYTYDFRGLLTSVTLAFGTTQAVTTVYAYDELGNEVMQTDAAGHSTRFQYDALGRKIGRTLPAGQTETFGYDLSGNLAWQTNFNRVVITNLYDVDNRLTNCSAPGYQVTYAYSPTGLRTNMVDASGTNSYAYDNLSRLTNKVVAWKGGPTVALHYRYDALGTLTNLWSGTLGGVTNVYQYDLLGRLTTVLASNTTAASYGYDIVGNLRATHYANGVTNLYQYDARNRLTSLAWNSNGTTLASFAYTVGPTGNRTALAETVSGANRTYNWAYDYLYRMTGETFGGTGYTGSPSVTYAFDAVGNRTNRTSNVSGISSQAPAYTANDWLTSDAYDTNGNTTISGTTNYQYDALNHLTNVSSGPIAIAYDGDGNRVKKTVSGTTTYYLLDDKNSSGYAQVLEEWTSTGTPALSRVYNYGLALVSQRQVSSGTLSYFCTDGHGSTRFLTDVNGNITDTYSFDAFGMLISSTGSTLNNYLYCGQQFDRDLGFYYLRARYYKPDSGRFWTMDTYDGNSEDPLSLHKYLYAQADPIDHSDPSGKMVYKLQVKSSFVVSGYCVFDHRLIVGDTGSDYSGSCYSLEFWGDEGALFGTKYEPVKVATWHYTHYQASATDTIKAIINKAGYGHVADKVTTSVDVDKQLNQEAAQLDGYADTYILGWNDCGTGANKWLNEALRLQPRFVPPLTGGQNYISSFSIDIGSISGFGL